MNTAAQTQSLKSALPRRSPFGVPPLGGSASSDAGSENCHSAYIPSARRLKAELQTSALARSSQFGVPPLGGATSSATGLTKYHAAPTPRAFRLKAELQTSAALVALALALLFLAPAHLHAQVVADTLGGGPSQLNPTSSAGSADGDTAATAQFNQPAGLALDSTGRYLFLADTGNNAVRRLDLTAGQTTTIIAGLNRPVDVALDPAGNLHVLTQGDGLIRRYDSFGNLIATNNATALSTPSAFALDAAGNCYVTELAGGGALRFVNATNRAVTTLAPVAAIPLSAPRGVVVLDNGNVAISDSGNHAIRIFNPGTLTLTTLTGLNGAGAINGTASVARLNSPHRIAKAGGGFLVVADTGNQQLRKIAPDGTVSVLYGLAPANWYTGPNSYPGWVDGTAPVAEAREPEGVVVNGSGDVFVTEQFYHLVRKATGTALTGPSGSSSGGGDTNGSSGITLNPPSLTLAPNSGYFPMGQLLTVTSSSTNVFFTTDGTEPTTNSTRLAISGGTGTIRWASPTNDLASLRLRAFVFSGTNSASTNLSGLAAPVTTIGVPPGYNATLAAGIGSTIVVPVVVNLRAGDRLKSLQFRVEVTPNGAAPMILDQFRALPISSNDFIATITSDQAGAPALFNSLGYTFGTTRGLALSMIGTNSNLSVSRFGVAAMLAVPIPPGAANGDSYQITVLQPSGTSDGLQTPVTLTPLASQTITVQSLSYLVGDTASSGWYNAGDFGSGDLDNSDVNNVFYASLGIRLPYSFTDAFDAMDAYPEDADGTVGGDHQIRFLDWQIILLRSLRLNGAPGLGVSTNNWSRGWAAGGVRTNGTTTLRASLVRRLVPPGAGEIWVRHALLGAGIVENAAPGTDVSVPVFVKVGALARLSGLQFRAIVSPVGLATPPLESAAQFVPLAAGALAPVNFTATQIGCAWNLGALNLAGQTRTVLGQLRFRIPAAAARGDAYRIQFANADGAPDLATQYEFETLSGAVWIGPAPRPADGISDEWKIRFFGTVDDPRAAPDADPDGDGVPNLAEFLAGTDPTDRGSRPRLDAAARLTNGRPDGVALRLLTAPGKLYVSEWSPSLVVPNWTPFATNSGDGYSADIPAPSAPGGTGFYRLRVLP